MKSIFLFFCLHKKRTTWLAILWTLMILVACLIPGRDVPHVGIPFADKWVHFIIFAGFSFLWLCTFQRFTTKKMGLMFVLSVLLGYAVELLQASGITVGRSFDLHDLLADSIGGALGVLIFYMLRKAYGNTK